MFQILSIKFENEEVGELGEVAWVDKKKNFFIIKYPYENGKRFLMRGDTKKLRRGS